MGNWQLFVDESGRFEEDGDLGVVGGLLVRGILGPRDADVIQQTLMESVYPWTTYPPHAVALNYSASRPAFDISLSERERRTPASDAEKDAKRLAAPGSAALRNPSAHVALVDLYLVAKRGAGRWAPASGRVVDLMSAATSALRNSTDPRERAVHHSLEEALLEPQDKAMRRLCAALGRPLRRSVGATPVMAWGAANVHSGGPHGRIDPYAARLQVLFERVAAIVGAHEGEHVVYLHVAHRPLYLEGQPSLTPRRVVAMFGDAAGDAGVRARVSCAAGAPESYDWLVRSGIVIADYLTNRACQRVLAGVPVSWSLRGVHTLFEAKTGMKPSITVSLDGVERDLPTIAVEGPAQSAIRTEAAPPASGPQWEREQAEAWINARAAMRATGLIQ